MSKLLAALTVSLATAPLTDGAMRTEVDRLVTGLGAARHLPFHGTLPARIVPRDVAQRESAIAVGVGLSGAGRDVEGEILKRLGLLPAGVDYGALVAKTAGSLDASYDVATGRLSVPDFVSLGDQRIALGHAIAHALADQHFGLRDFLRLAPDGGRRLEGDAERARLAVVEGDATLTGLELQDPHEAFLGRHELSTLGARLREATATEGAPLWLVELARFTHVDGFLFTARARAQGPWSAVDALWADPPASTEQVLHPEKYDACEAPIPVDEATLPTLPGFGRPAASDVLGELVARTWLASVLPPEIATRAAAGWGGDRAGIYTARPGASPDGGAAPERPLAWLTIWDDSGEAEDFARAATQVLVALTTSAPATNGPAGGRAVFPSAAGLYALDRRGEAVALLFAAPPSTLPAPPALDEMLDRWRRQQNANRKSATHPRHAAPPNCPRRDRAGGRG